VVTVQALWSYVDYCCFLRCVTFIVKKPKFLWVLVFGFDCFCRVDRIYLNVHWFSDVLGGFLLGVFWLSLAILVFYILRDAGKFQSKAFRTLSSLLFVLGFAVGVVIIIYFFLGVV
jgi:hypothetical protein